MDHFLLRLLEGANNPLLKFLSSPFKAQNLRIDCAKLDSVEYCEEFLSRAGNSRQIFDLGYDRLLHRVWELFERSLGSVEKGVLGLVLQEEGKAREIEYLAKEIGMGLISKI